MDKDERDPDLVAEIWLDRRRNAVARGRAQAWNEPYSEDEFPCPRCDATRCIDRPDGCEDPLCP